MNKILSELGELSERPKEHDWKSCRRDKRLEGSNPSLSAIYSINIRGFAICGEAPLSLLAQETRDRCRNERVCTLGTVSSNRPAIDML